MRNLLQLAAFSSFAFLVACNNPQSAQQIAGAASNGQEADANRAMTTTAKKAIASAYYYKTLAAFKMGKAQVDLQTMVDLENANVNLVVLFESGAAWAAPFNAGDLSKTADDKFNGLLDSYGLVIAKHFEIDDMNEGLVLEGNKGKIGNPIEAAREISLVDAVMMVEVKELPATENTNSTVSK